MQIAYVDESNSDGHFYVGALIVDSHQIHEIRTKLDLLMKNLGLVVNDEKFKFNEIKGKELWKGSACWDHDEFGERLRKSIILNVLAILINANAKISIQSINSLKLGDRYSRPFPPYTLGFKFLLESIDAEFRNSGRKGIVISDRLGSVDEHQIQLRNLSEYQENGTGGHFLNKLENIADLNYVDSRESRLIQAIDVVVFLIRRRALLRNASVAEIEFLDRINFILEPHVIRNRDW